MAFFLVSWLCGCVELRKKVKQTSVWLGRLSCPFNGFCGLVFQEGFSPSPPPQGSCHSSSYASATSTAEMVSTEHLLFLWVRNVQIHTWQGLHIEQGMILFLKWKIIPHAESLMESPRWDLTCVITAPWQRARACLVMTLGAASMT